MQKKKPLQHNNNYTKTKQNKNHHQQKAMISLTSKVVSPKL